MKEQRTCKMMREVGLYLVNDDLVHKVKERMRDDRRFTISDLPLHFPHISRTLLYGTVSSG